MTPDGPDLGAALDALRALGDDAGGDRGTRDRVLETLDRRDHRRRQMVAVAVVLAICLTGTTSWAWISGWLPAVVKRIVSSEPAPAPAPPPSAPEPKASRAAKPVTRVVEEPAAAAAPAPAPAIVVAEATVIAAAEVPVAAKKPGNTNGDPRGAAGRRARPETAAVPAPAPVITTDPDTRTATPMATPGDTPTGTDPRPVPVSDAVPSPVPVPAPVSVPDAELRAYRVAHAAHFRGSDAPRALAAWDAYLAAFPDGKLAPEGRWNRALVLVRLGRTDDAARALAPFASAAPGGYRQREAARLLDVLRARR